MSRLSKVDMVKRYQIVEEKVAAQAQPSKRKIYQSSKRPLKLEASLKQMILIDNMLQAEADYARLKSTSSR